MADGQAMVPVQVVVVPVVGRVPWWMAVVHEELSFQQRAGTIARVTWMARAEEELPVATPEEEFYTP